jgi:hypothetical protein
VDEFGRELTVLGERAGLSVRQVAGKIGALGQFRSHSTLGDWFVWAQRA